MQSTIDEINSSLKAYGFTNFSIQPAKDREDYYCIQRDDGSVVHDSLSEGEETFLTFLYFMQMSKGSTKQDRVFDKKILVFDDPVSSLDSMVLYVVSSAIKELCESINKGMGDVTQFFVLTHNVFFHREASLNCKGANYWIIRKNNNSSSIQSCGDKNPVSASSYELLWRELRENNSISLISIQNLMRRIIECYFGILGKKRYEILLSNFKTAEEQLVAKSLISWVNDGSHIVPDDFFVDSYMEETISRYKSVFRQIFENSGQISHFNMMMEEKI